MKDRSDEFTAKKIAEFFVWLNGRLNRPPQHKYYVGGALYSGSKEERAHDVKRAMEFAEICQWASARLALLEKMFAGDLDDYETHMKLSVEAHERLIREQKETEKEKSKEDNLQFTVEVESFVDEAVKRLEEQIIEPMLDERLNALTAAARIGLFNNILRSVSKKIRSDDGEK